MCFTVQTSSNFSNIHPSTALLCADIDGLLNSSVYPINPSKLHCFCRPKLSGRQNACLIHVYSLLLKFRPSLIPLYLRYLWHFSVFPLQLRILLIFYPNNSIGEFNAHLIAFRIHAARYDWQLGQLYLCQFYFCHNYWLKYNSFVILPLTVFPYFDSCAHNLKIEQYNTITLAIMPLVLVLFTITITITITIILGCATLHKAVE